MRDDTATRTAIAARYFTDAGTSASYNEGDPVDVEPGVLLNYERAGLIAKAASDAPSD